MKCSPASSIKYDVLLGMYDWTVPEVMCLTSRYACLKGHFATYGSSKTSRAKLLSPMDVSGAVSKTSPPTSTAGSTPAAELLQAPQQIADAAIGETGNSAYEAPDEAADGTLVQVSPVHLKFKLQSCLLWCEGPL